MLLVCEICFQPFDVPPSHAPKRHTCSRKCMAEYKRRNPDPGQYAKGHSQSNTGRTRFHKGHMPSEVARKAASERCKATKGHKFPDRQGPNCHLWKGGITPINHAVRTSLDFVLWRKAVFERDNYTCQICGCRNGDGRAHELHAHHIRRFATYPPLRFVVSNGTTVCKDCHPKADAISRLIEIIAPLKEASNG